MDAIHHFILQTTFINIIWSCVSSHNHCYVFMSPFWHPAGQPVSLSFDKTITDIVCDISDDNATMVLLAFACIGFLSVDAVNRIRSKMSVVVRCQMVICFYKWLITLTFMPSYWLSNRETYQHYSRSRLWASLSLNAPYTLNSSACLKSNAAFTSTVTFRGLNSKGCLNRQKKSMVTSVLVHFTWYGSYHINVVF